MALDTVAAQALGLRCNQELHSPGVVGGLSAHGHHRGAEQLVPAGNGPGKVSTSHYCQCVVAAAKADALAVMSIAADDVADKPQERAGRKLRGYLR